MGEGVYVFVCGGVCLYVVCVYEYVHVYNKHLYMYIHCIGTRCIQDNKQIKESDATTEFEYLCTWLHVYVIAQAFYNMYMYLQWGPTRPYITCTYNGAPPGHTLHVPTMGPHQAIHYMYLQWGPSRPYITCTYNGAPPGHTLHVPTMGPHQAIHYMYLEWGPSRPYITCTYNGAPPGHTLHVPTMGPHQAIHYMYLQWGPSRPYITCTYNGAPPGHTLHVAPQNLHTQCSNKLHV